MQHGRQRALRVRPRTATVHFAPRSYQNCSFTRPYTSEFNSHRDERVSWRVREEATRCTSIIYLSCGRSTRDRRVPRDTCRPESLTETTFITGLGVTAEDA